MADFQFSNKQVAEIYQTEFVHNPKVRVPKLFMGRVADLTPEACEALIKMGSNVVTRKTPKVTLAEKAACESKEGQS